MSRVPRTALLALAIAASAILMMETASRAESVFLDFNIDAAHPTTAKISYDGVGGPLVGVDISVDSVLGINTPANDGVIRPIIGGILSFSTGPFIGSDANNWYFGAGGNITITGDAGFGHAVLLDGIFSEAHVDRGTLIKVGISAFLDNKDEDLADYYGLGGNLPWLGAFNLSFAANGTPPQGFVSTRVFSGDVVNSPVPEPSSIMMACCAGLAGLAFYLRRRG